MFNKILIATHGTDGAKKAEAYAVGLARALGAELHGLYVIHKGWGSLVGIEWLHSSETRMEFYRYAESELTGVQCLGRLPPVVGSRPTRQ